MPFHEVLTGSLASGVFSTLIQPSAFPRIALEADVWAHFRIRKLAFRMLPTSPSTVIMAAGYVGGVEDTAPGSFAQVSELITSCIKGVGQTVPTNWVRIPKVDLSGPFPWYKSLPGTADPTEESPGQLSVVGTGTEAYAIELKGVIEFKVSVNSANTPAALAARRILREERVRAQVERERTALLKVLTANGQKVTC